METERKQQVTGYVFIVVALLMVLQGVYLSIKQDQETQCQADYNAQTSAVQKQRSDWADEDRAALNDMIKKLIDPKATPQASSRAVRVYVQTSEQNDKNRKENPLPARTSCSYGWL